MNSSGAGGICPPLIKKKKKNILPLPYAVASIESVHDHIKRHNLLLWQYMSG